MRVAVMAAGALGGYFGARMAAAGHDVFFIARNVNLEAIRTNGLRIESVLGDLQLPNPNVTDDLTQIGSVDIVLFAVKLWDTEKAAEQVRPLVRSDTRVITLQNGVDSAERLVPILGFDRVVAGCAYIAAAITAPGVVTHTSKFARLICGRTDGEPDAMLKVFAEAPRPPSSTLRYLRPSSASDGRNLSSWRDCPAQPQQPESRLDRYLRIATPAHSSII